MVSKDYQRRTASIWYQSACLLDAPVYPAKTAEPIGMLFGARLVYGVSWSTVEAGDP